MHRACRVARCCVHGVRLPCRVVHARAEHKAAAASAPRSRPGSRPGSQLLSPALSWYPGGSRAPFGPLKALPLLPAAASDWRRAGGRDAGRAAGSRGRQRRPVGAGFGGQPLQVSGGGMHRGIVRQTAATRRALCSLTPPCQAGLANACNCSTKWCVPPALSSPPSIHPPTSPPFLPVL